MKSQRGVSLVGLIIIGFLLVVVAIPAIRVLPEYVEYYKVLKNVKAVAQDPGSRDASVTGIRNALARRFDVDYIRDISPQDMEVAKSGGSVEISFSYTRKVPLVGNLSLLIDFEGSSSGS